MKIRWFGQSAFLVSGSVRVAIDLFGDRLAAHGLQFAYPRIEGVDADVLLITHEHFDHSAARSSRSRSTGCGCVTSETSARPPCARSSARRSAMSTS